MIYLFKNRLIYKKMAATTASSNDSVMDIVKLITKINEENPPSDIVQDTTPHETDIDADDIELDLDKMDNLDDEDEMVHTAITETKMEEKTKEEILVSTGTGFFGNPFFSYLGKKRILDTMTAREIAVSYSCVFLLVSKDGTSETVKNPEDREKFCKMFQNTISEEDLRNFSKYFTLVKTSIKVLKNREHYRQSNVIKSNYLEHINGNGYRFEDKEIVVLMPELEEKDVNFYIGSFEKEKTISDILNLVLISSHYSHEYNPTLYKLVTALKNLDETKYWTRKTNCSVSFSDDFLERSYTTNRTTGVMVMGDSNISEDTKKVIGSDEYDRKTKALMDKLDYMNFILDKGAVKDTVPKEKKSYVDLASSIQKSSQRTYYAPKQSIETMKLDKEKVTQIFMSLDPVTNQHIMYDIFNSLLMTKDYCHLVLNNEKVLERMTPIINKYFHLYRYLIGYAWLCFYTEEGIWKTKTKNEMRYVFDINTANKLPVFPYSIQDIKTNPYLTSLIDNENMDIANNCLSLMMHETTHYGVCTLEQFKWRFNVFTTGNPDVGIFDGIDWTMYAVSGSVIPACVQKYSPLFSLFSAESECEKWQTYFNSYYGESDIDLMSNKKNIIEYLGCVNDVCDTIERNIARLQPTGERLEKNKVEITPKKSFCVSVREEYIRQNLDSINAKIGKTYTYDDFVKNISSVEVRGYFYEIYCENKPRHTDAIKSSSGYVHKKINDMFFAPCTLDDMNIILANYYIDKNKELIDNVCILDSMIDDIVVLRIVENIKFKMKSAGMNHSVEMFRAKGDDFFSTVARFHLPCVRGYYSNNNVYLLPSCITAMMTGINIDYKYFAGIRDPVEILNKYRVRGFGIILNKKEKELMLEYNLSSEIWKKVFGLSPRGKGNMQKLFGPKNIQHMMFRPLVYTQGLPDELYLKPILPHYADKLDVVNYYMVNHKYNDGSGSNIISISKLNTISFDGTITPMKKWLADAFYEETEDKEKTHITAEENFVRFKKGQSGIKFE